LVWCVDIWFAGPVP